MGYNRPIPGILSHLDCVKCFRQGSDLIDFDKDRIRYSPLNSLFQPLCVGDKEIVSHQLMIHSKPCCQDLPAFPVLLIHILPGVLKKVHRGEGLPGKGYLQDRHPGRR